MTAPLWTAQEASAATGGETSGDWAEVAGLSIDTRTLMSGDLFIALEGDNRDGHVFVGDALSKGAGAAMVSRRPEGVGQDAPLLIVGDTLDALGGLGRAARARTGARIIAVTGSVGKTTTKEMVRTILADQGRVHAAEHSYNNHWGVPLTLARMPKDSDFAVIEIGMNHPGEIEPLARLARPHVAVITAVEAVHLAAFDSVDAIADAKAEIFTGLEQGGVAVIDADSPYYEHLANAAGDATLVSFGNAPCDFQLATATVTEDSTLVRAVVHGMRHSFRIGAPGVHLARNALAALAATDAVSADIVRAGFSLGHWAAPEGRGVRWRIELGPGGLDGEITLIDESYNANPASVRAVLAVLGQARVMDDIGRVARGRRIAFLGDMLELGSDEMEIHAALADLAELRDVDLVHCCGPRMKALWAALPREHRGQWFENSENLAERVRRMVDAGDVCMVKGSLGMRMSRVVEAIKLLGRTRDARTGDEE